MIKTHKEAQAHRYGSWGGNPKGESYVEGKCAEEISTRDQFAVYYQCTRNNGHGIEGLYCKQHDPEAVKARKAATEKKWRKDLADEIAISEHFNLCVTALEGIADPLEFVTAAKALAVLFSTDNDTSEISTVAAKLRKAWRGE